MQAMVKRNLKSIIIVIPRKKLGPFIGSFSSMGKKEDADHIQERLVQMSTSSQELEILETMQMDKAISTNVMKSARMMKHALHSGWKQI